MKNPFEKFKVKKHIEKYKNASYENRTIMTNSFTYLFNYAWSIGKFIMGIYLQSYYLCLIALFTFFVGTIKKNCTQGYKKNLSDDLIIKQYINGGVLISISGMIYIAYTVRLLLHPINFKYSLITALTIATFSFTMIILAIIGIIKTKGKNLLLREIKLLALCSALTDIALTQIALLSFSNTINSAHYNALLGICVGISILLIGLYIIISGLIKKYRH